MSLRCQRERQWRADACGPCPRALAGRDASGEGRAHRLSWRGAEAHFLPSRTFAVKANEMTRRNSDVDITHKDCRLVSASGRLAGGAAGAPTFCDADRNGRPIERGARSIYESVKNFESRIDLAAVRHSDRGARKRRGCERPVGSRRRASRRGCPTSLRAASSGIRIFQRWRSLRQPIAKPRSVSFGIRTSLRRASRLPPHESINTNEKLARRARTRIKG